MNIITPPYRSVNVEKSLVFKKADTEDEKQAIYQSRLNICQQNFPYLLDFKNAHPAKDRYDDYSTLFYTTVENKIVASCRITPFLNNEWEISPNLPKNLKLNLNTYATVQLNRVYIEKDHRNQNMHEFMFYHFSEWVLANTHYTDYFAICNVGLVRLYKRVGAVLGKEDGFNLKGRGDHLYYFVKGNINEFNNIIKLNNLNHDTYTN